MGEYCPEVETLERKLKRWNIREAMNVDSVTRTSVKSCGNMSADKKDHMTVAEETDDDDYITYLNAEDSHIDSEMDEDHASFLDGYASKDHSPGDNNVYASNIDVNLHDHIRHEREEEEEEEEEERFRNKHLDTTTSNGLNVECDVEDEDYVLFLNSGSKMSKDLNMDEDYELFLNSGSNKMSKDLNTDEDYALLLNSGSNKMSKDLNMDGDYALFLNSGSNKMSKDSKMDEDYALFLNSGTGSIDGENLANTGNGLIRKRSSIRQISQVSDKAFYTRKVLCGFDEDYQEILNSPGNLEYMSDKINTKTSKAFDTCKVQCDSDEDSQAFLNSASDKNTAKTSEDVIILEKEALCENTPFVLSRAYDSSFFEKEGNPKDSRRLDADLHSPFRRRLMECLEKPYDQHEYIEFLKELLHQKHKERHLDLRKVVKSYRTGEFSKSYIELYPDFLKAIVEFKDEPAKVLFLLRGFFFWLQNLPHDGVFRPWDDETCLETLRKL